MEGVRVRGAADGPVTLEFDDSQSPPAARFPSG